MSNLLDIPETLQLLKRAVEEKGADYIYTADPVRGCVYRNSDGSPGCIVGHVFAYVGLLNDDIEEGVGPDQPPVKDRFTDEARDLLDRVQNSQDDGDRWGVAVAQLEGADA